MPQKIPHPLKGMTVAQLMARDRIAPPNAAGINYTTVPHSTQEGQRNWQIQANLGAKNFMGNVITRVVLPHDTKDSQTQREVEQRRQTAMPWGNHFMVTATDADRLNNPAQTAAMKQKQLAPPSTYAQFYAFMRALSAAFGTLQRGR